MDTSLNGERVVRVLERLKETRGLPAVLQTDNGPEFNGKLREECLKQHWFKSIEKAGIVIEE